MRRISVYLLLISMSIVVVNAQSKLKKEAETTKKTTESKTKKEIEAAKKEAENAAKEAEAAKAEAEKAAAEAAKAELAKKAASAAPISVGEGFAMQPLNPLEIGLSLGLHAIWGDASSKIGLNLDNSTFGLHIRKAFNHHFSMRLQYNYGQATNRALQPRYTAAPNAIFSGLYYPINPLQTNQDLWLIASQTYSHTLSLDQIFTIGNSSIYRKGPNFIFNIFAGPSLVLYRTKLNLGNSSGAYNWSNAESEYVNALVSDPINGANKAKDAVAKWMDNNLDDSYESLASNNGAKSKLFDMAMVPGISLGASVAFKINDKFNLELNQRFLYAIDDYLDGERYHSVVNSTGKHDMSFSQNNDIITNTTLGLNYNLGGPGAKPKYWQNENEYMLKKMAQGNDNKKLIQEAFADSDGDGVPNKIDQEEESREGCPVDTRGVMLDSDKDGILDCDDEEPYSPFGYPIDSKGKAIVPPPACCDQVKTGSTESKPNTNSACAETSIPSVKFAFDKYSINAESQAQLKSLGEKMQTCPDMRIVISGINDKNSANGKYNEQLSYNRAMAVASYLSENFGISRDRFIIKYNMEGIGDRTQDRVVMFRHAQNGEYGNNNPASPHPGLRAGSK